MAGKILTMEILHREGLSRIGRFQTDHGKVDTPNIMPVINPNIMTLPIDKMVKMGAQALITNSYIIRRNGDLKERALNEGLHKLIGFDGTIMTDSGTFQSYMYGEVEYQNVDTVDFQTQIGSDISTILDIFSTPSDNHEKAEYAVDETYRRFQEIEAMGRKHNISGPVQGSIYKDLRAKSASLMSGTTASYMPIGGVVPLLEQYNYSTLVDIILTSKLNSDFSKPIHLFGGGHPMFMAMAVLMGVDMFDSASYVKYARDGRLLYTDGTRYLEDVTELPFWSPLRDRYTVMELKKAEIGEKYELLAEHNLFAIFQELSEIRERIRENTLWQYVEGKSRTHPALYSAFQRLLTYSKILEPYEELYRKSPIFHFGSETNDGPYGERLKKISLKRGEMERTPPGTWKPARMSRKFIQNVYEQTDKPYSIDWYGIDVPIEMEESYPVEQVVSGPYEEPRDLNIHREKNRIESIEHDTEMKIRSFNLEKVRFLSDVQFGFGTGKELFPDSSLITVSRSTGRIRTISVNGKILATMRTHDGYLGLTMDGASIIHKKSKGIENRVMVTSESAEFNRRGSSVFFKFILEYDRDIIALNDVLVVDPDDNLVAVGRSTVSGREMGMYREGVAVLINHHIKSTTKG